MSRITKIEAVKKQPKKKIRVAAYAMVSTGSDKQLASLDTQKRHYEQYIKARPDWDYAGLYFDEGVTGTKMAKREGLLQMLGDCERGLIDYIIVKSISRFSRNTVESIETIRRLSEKGIYIFFEKENIDTGKMESELLLSILSSLAESESRSIAENSKWSVQKRFANGTYKLGYMPYGYKKVDGDMVVDEDEAKIVRQIFADYISGKSTQTIARKLNERGISPKRGNTWSAHVVGGMIKNEKYIGDVLLGKTYTDSQFNRHINHGERDMYYIENHHPAIVSKEDFESLLKTVTKDLHLKFISYLQELIWGLTFGTQWDAATVCAPIESSQSGATYILGGRFKECCALGCRLDDKTMCYINKDIHNRVYSLLVNGYFD